MSFKKHSIVNEEEAPCRVDLLLALSYPQYSRSYFQQLIERGDVTYNQQPVKKRELIPKGGVVFFDLVDPPLERIEPIALPIEILYEDEWMAFINKPAGVATHPGDDLRKVTLCHMLLHHFPNLHPDPIRPGIVHRLDLGTSGVLVIAKDPMTHNSLTEQFKNRTVEKRYLALVHGSPIAQEICLPIGRDLKNRHKMAIQAQGKEAFTSIQPLEYGEKLTWVAAFPKTGRTHQIRLHLKAIGSPILGDPLYGPSKYASMKKVPRLCLHAEQLTLYHPKSQEKLSIKAPLPLELLELKEALLPKGEIFEAD